ncbi:hypothetical protein [uncultured Cellulomonas sp.]|uniref:hypothetical protein n=1 Tax=uncultured Cellulomonas sp. TaxID=189682 RepID=UPI0028F0683D|nr:hypothetical protein [uncultured Cellulomonas sp.]
MITIDPAVVATFGNGQLTAAIGLSSPRTTLASVAIGSDALGEADDSGSLATMLDGLVGDVTALVADLASTLEVDGEALLLVAAQNVDANTGDAPDGPRP